MAIDNPFEASFIGFVGFIIILFIFCMLFDENAWTERRVATMTCCCCLSILVPAAFYIIFNNE